MKKLHHILKEVELVRFMGDAEILIKGLQPIPVQWNLGFFS